MGEKGINREKIREVLAGKEEKGVGRREGGREGQGRKV